ncbi:hypothetical protein BpHYR1_037726 [Brachionus plicatilis]|uniref:Uncharacterized protein n=1 Tax=Brachionus plicatilis TaxID=10195 RepID=A0A3M7SB09_BRAPC|nr:hypothetical protein BpHYR1_037726 [Brachionus plicatilis]
MLSEKICYFSGSSEIISFLRSLMVCLLSEALFGSMKFFGIGIGWVAVVVKLQSLVALLIESKMSAIILSASVSIFAFAVEITDNNEFWKVAIDKV